MSKSYHQGKFDGLQEAIALIQSGMTADGIIAQLRARSEEAMDSMKYESSKVAESSIKKTDWDNFDNSLNDIFGSKINSK